MKSTLFFSFFTIHFLFSQSDLENALNAYTLRSKGSIKNIAKPIHINSAIAFYNSALHKESSPEAAIGILKSYYFKGKYVINDIEEKKVIFDKAVKLGIGFIDQYPNDAGIRYWYLTNLGSWAEVFGIIAAAREGFADIMKMNSEKIIDLDPEYKDGGGYFMLGVVHLRTPYIPFLLSWPDKDEAERLLKIALNTGEQPLVQKVYYAKALYQNDRQLAAEKILIEVSNAAPSKDNHVEDWDQIIEAKQFLVKIKN
ncbi:MAG: hypothetical protein VX731_01500 [Candidatus Neomarinimicrobiota bacterium]|nr:hypothetical protein [Candidatus Neomarinimicrobiota bacterium]